jgi:DNA repair protein RecN (Recombination protein N)
MLKELSIRNLAVIEHVTLQFQSGFHVLTGETGAGKSIIIDALSLTIGARGSSDLIRHDSDKLEIEAVFEIQPDHPTWGLLEANGIEADPKEHIIVRREMTIQGKSTCRLNGQLVNLSTLREVGEWLVNIHGQHEHQSLLKTENHLQWLDAYGNREISVLKDRYREAYEKYMQLQKDVTQLEEQTQLSLQKLDLYQFQIQEISDAKLKIGEEEQLQEERNRLASAEKLSHHAAESYELLYGPKRGLEALNRAIEHLRNLASIDKNTVTPWLEQAESAYFQIEDISHQLRDYRDRVEFNPIRLQQVELRLDMIHGLRRKYGETISDILAHYQKISLEVENILNKDDIMLKLKQELLEQGTQLALNASQLSQQRKIIAEQLATSIVIELRELQMERTQFIVKVNQLHDENGIVLDGAKYKFNREGIDVVEFLLAPNPGEPLRELSKIASGGELSRIMLALKTIFAKIDQVPVLVFDEVDTGVSGRAAQSIAEKLSKLSRSCQVFSITHLPQVACMADVHYYIHKNIDQNRTQTRVHDLDAELRIHELARMLGGVEVTSTTLHHAQEMLALAKEKKSNL